MTWQLYLLLFQIVFCAGVVDSVNGVVSCTSFTISCGSVVVQANVNVEAEIDQQITKTEDKQAPVTQQKFMEQLAQNIQNNQNFSKYGRTALWL